MAEQQTNGATEQAQGPQFAIQRIYAKDISYETPNSPAIFKQEWKPEVKLDIDTRSTQLDEGIHEVVLSLTVTTKVGEDVAFLCEVQQAGIFTIGAVEDAQKAHMLGSFCPNILFPYARECASNLVNRGTFPALNLAPVNFDAIFAAYLQKRAEAAKGQETATADA